VIIVESEADYKKWLATQKSEYSTIYPAAGAADSTKAATPAVALNN
jgi:heme/copper-type cytochrome/quinol oxidase subunit 2